MCVQMCTYVHIDAAVFVTSSGGTPRDGPSGKAKSCSPMPMFTQVSTPGQMTAAQHDWGPNRPQQLKDAFKGSV